jgi:hypothetical protein
VMRVSLADCWIYSRVREVRTEEFGNGAGLTWSDRNFRGTMVRRKIAAIRPSTIGRALPVTV